MVLVWSQEHIYYDRGTDLYRYKHGYNDIHGEYTMRFTEHLMCCGVEREAIYMGGGITIYKCHSCGDTYTDGEVK